jgi:hypothetical protein
MADRIEQLEERVRALRALVESAYHEGFSAGVGVGYRDRNRGAAPVASACWPYSRARKALEVEP